jgi:magnesium transporter
MTMNRFDIREKLHLELLNWDGLTWVNIEKPTEKEKEYLAQNYPFHSLDLDDCLSRIQRPKIDEYKDYLFLVLHFPIYNKQLRVSESSQVSVFIGDRYLITLHDGKLKPLVALFHECQDNEERRQQYLGSGSGYLLYRIVDRLVDYCLPIMNKLGQNIDSVEESIFSNRKHTRVREISELRRDAISLRRIIGPMRVVIGGLEPKIRRYNQKDLGVYFGDTVDHLDKIWDALEEHKEVIEGLNSTYDSLASDRMNDILRVLTILATIGTVLTVIVGFYGMNIPLPGGSNPGGHIYSWLALIILMLGVIGGMLLYFRRKEWL